MEGIYPLNLPAAYAKEEINLSDLQRQNDIEYPGIKVIRFTNSQVIKEFDEAMNRINNYIQKLIINNNLPSTGRFQND
jgi:very-short-patch-repair endonuclease